MTRQPVDRAFNVAVCHVAARLFPTGFDVADIAPETFDALREHVASTGRMLVWSGASDHTMFADREVNFAFRAWHDWTHLAGGFDFSPQGEAQACAMQQDHIRALYGNGETADRFCQLLAIEVIEQGAYAAEHGDFPADQYAFTLATLAQQKDSR